MIVVGIDPGLTGAIAFLRVPLPINGCQPQVLGMWDTPTLSTEKRTEYNPVGMTASLRAVRSIGLVEDVLVILEAVHAMPGQGVTSMFRFGEGFGMWQGIVAAIGFPLVKVAPQRWKRALMGDMPKEKDASRLRALQLYPEHAEGLKLKKHHGRAEALLLATYGARYEITKAASLNTGEVSC